MPWQPLRALLFLLSPLLRGQLLSATVSLALPYSPLSSFLSLGHLWLAPSLCRGGLWFPGAACEHKNFSCLAVGGCFSLLSSSCLPHCASVPDWTGWSGQESSPGASPRLLTLLEAGFGTKCPDCSLLLGELKPGSIAGNVLLVSFLLPFQR